MQDSHLPQKAHNLLIFAAAIFFLILVRIFVLSSFMHDHYLAKSQKPQHSIQSKPALRGKLYDRFGHVLATNKLQYNASIIYDDIRAIPRVSWERDEQGKKVKVYTRKNYIQKLALSLSHFLTSDAEHIEDLIHAKAAIFPGSPCIIESDINEATYYQLKMQERLLPGLHMQKGVSRVYPHGKTAGSIIGYLGAINQNQYYTIISQIDELQAYLSAINEGIPTPLPRGFHSLHEVSNRLDSLLEKVYTMNTQVGKFGLEKALESELRGIPGKRGALLGRGGVHLGSLPVNKQETKGKTISLALSIELQEFAEKLLIHNEGLRKTHPASPGLWIKGGAIVAMVPQTGEVVAMASYPRMDPSDFILNVNKAKKKERNQAINKWIESKQYALQIFNGMAPLEREVLYDLKKEPHVEKKRLSWPVFLDAILSKKSQIRRTLSPSFTLGQSLIVQEEVNNLNTLFPDLSLQEILPYTKNEYTAPLQALLNPIKKGKDKCLFIDLLRINANCKHMNASNLGNFTELTLSHHHDLRQAYCRAEKAIYEASFSLFKTHCFAPWRKEHFANFLALKRAEEKQDRRCAKPYINHLAQAKKSLFKEFWNENKWSLIKSYLFEDLLTSTHLKALSFHLLLMSKAETDPSISMLKKVLLSHPIKHSVAYLKGVDASLDLSFSLHATYPSMLPTGRQKGHDLCRAFFPKYGFGFGKPFTHSQALPTGSIFKIVTAYEGLKTCQKKDPANLNPLTLIDQIHTYTRAGKPTTALGKWMNGVSIPRYYKGGRLPKSYKSLGPLNLTQALAKSSNLYFSILAGDYINSSSDLLEAAHEFGFGEKTGIELTNEKKGLLPTDLRNNKTGLYAFSIGQHTLLSTPLQTALCLSGVANKGVMMKPTLVKETESSFEDDLFNASSFPFKTELNTVGINFPFFTESFSPPKQTLKLQHRPTLIRSIDMPDSIHAPLIKGLKKVVQDPEGSCHLSKIQSLLKFPQWRKIYRDMAPYVIGKSSSAEFTYKAHLDSQTKPLLTQDIWFGGVSFKEDNEPELTVVVYLHFGDYGKEAAPLALLVMDKYRKLCKQYAKPNSSL